MDKILFQKITVTQIQHINVQQILVVTFEFTGAARGFMIMSCAARGVKKVGQHWLRGMDSPVRSCSCFPFLLFLFCSVLQGSYPSSYWWMSHFATSRSSFFLSAPPRSHYSVHHLSSLVSQRYSPLCSFWLILESRYS